ncbi:MAG: hypothetical protein AAGD25_02130 [Cyanobacteria bacterium P01_F01_bin.150]
MVSQEWTSQAGSAQAGSAQAGSAQAISVPVTENYLPILAPQKVSSSEKGAHNDASLEKGKQNDQEVSRCLEN